MKNSSILSKFLLFLLATIPLGIYAKDKCATQIDKDFLGDCQSSGDHPPEKCIKVHPTAGGDTINTQDADCLAEGCAQECKAKGGDEILWYSKTVLTGQYNNYICCKSKTPAQAQKTTKSCEQCKLVSDYFPPTTTPTTPTTPSTIPSTTPTTPTTPTTTSSAVPSDDTNPFLAILLKALS